MARSRMARAFCWLAWASLPEVDCGCWAASVRDKNKPKNAAKNLILFIRCLQDVSSCTSAAPPGLVSACSQPLRAGLTSFPCRGLRYSSCQNGPAVHIEDLTGNETRMGRTQEQRRCRDLFRLAHPAP